MSATSHLSLVRPQTDDFRSFATHLAAAQQQAALASAQAVSRGGIPGDQAPLRAQFHALQLRASELHLNGLTHILQRMERLLAACELPQSLSARNGQSLFEWGVRLSTQAQDIALGWSESTELIPRRPVHPNGELSPEAQLLEHAERATLEAARKQGRQVRVRPGHTPPTLPLALLPLLHRLLLELVRNAITHGIEAPEIRQAAGKSTCGIVDIVARMSGRDVIISVSDDGHGVVTQGPLPEPDTLWDHLVQQQGGLAAIQETLTRLSGRAQLRSWPGNGARFTLIVPADAGPQ